MKFLFVSNFERIPNSGAAGSLLSMGDALAARGHQVHYLWKTEEPYRFPHSRLQLLFELPKRQLHQVQEELKKESYDVVIVSQPYAYLIYEKLGNDYPHTLFLNRTHGWEDRADFARLRFGWDYHRPSFRRILTRFFDFMTHQACLRTAKTCQGLIAPSTFCAHFIQQSCGISQEKIQVIPYGLNDQFLNLPLPEREMTGPVHLLDVGNYIPMKGSHVMESLLPPLAREYRDMELTFVVPEVAHHFIKEHYGSVMGKRLKIQDWTHREELLSIYAQHDILLFPSLFEGFCKVILEAMASGLCVVGFGEGGLPQITHSEGGALYCEAGDIASLRTLLERCLLEKHYAMEIARRAPEFARHFTWKRTAEETEAFCLELRKCLIEKKSSA